MLFKLVFKLLLFSIWFQMVHSAKVSFIYSFFWIDFPVNTSSTVPYKTNYLQAPIRTYSKGYKRFKTNVKKFSSDANPPIQKPTIS